MNSSASLMGMRHSGHFAQSSPVRVCAGRFPRFRGGAAALPGCFSSSDMPGIYADRTVSDERREVTSGYVRLEPWSLWAWEELNFRPHAYQEPTLRPTDAGFVELQRFTGFRRQPASIRFVTAVVTMHGTTIACQLNQNVPPVLSQLPSPGATR